MTISRKVIKTGNSLALTIPSSVIQDFSVKEGDIALIAVDRSKVAITYTLTGHPRQLSLIDKKRPSV